MVPAGYTLVHDPYGFSFPLPVTDPPFERQPVASPFRIDYSPEPGDEIHLIRFGVTPGAGPLLAHIAQMRRTNTSFTVDQQPTTDVFDGYPGATWGWTYVKTLPGGTQQVHQAMEQLFIDSKGTEYDIMVDYPQSEWQTGYTRYVTILAGFTTP